MAKIFVIIELIDYCQVVKIKYNRKLQESTSRLEFFSFFFPCFLDFFFQITKWSRRKGRDCKENRPLGRRRLVGKFGGGLEMVYLEMRAAKNFLQLRPFWGSDRT